MTMTPIWIFLSSNRISDTLFANTRSFAFIHIISLLLNLINVEREVQYWKYSLHSRIFVLFALHLCKAYYVLLLCAAA